MTNTMNGTYYYQELPLAKVMNTMKALESRLYKEELNLAVKCANMSPAYVTLNLKNGDVIYVARKRNWKSDKNDYEMHVQVLEDDENKKLQVVAETKYMKSNEDGMLDLAAKIIRMSKR